MYTSGVLLWENSGVVVLRIRGKKSDIAIEKYRKALSPNCAKFKFPEVSSLF